MSCLSALPNQIATFLSVPHEVILLRHRVFREYAKIAVGPDFIHTLPSLIILTSMCLVVWKNPPRLTSLSCIVEKPLIHKIIQICCSWITINGVVWLWLIFQRIIYCSIWSYWSKESEYREIPLPWWQKVWSTFYPPPIEAPVLSSGFISWIVSMVLAGAVLGCALSIDRFIITTHEASRKVQDFFQAFDLNAISNKLLENILKTENVVEVEDNSEISSACDDCGSEISIEPAKTRAVTEKREIRPVAYGTDWTLRPKFNCNESNKQPKRKTSMQSLRTTVTVAGVIEPNERQDKYSPRQLRNRRGCHTVIPSYSSDKSSGC